MAGIEAFLTTLVINAAIAVVALLLFCLLRTRLGDIYSPRLSICERDGTSPPPAPPTGFLSWIWFILRLPEESITPTAGLDVTMHLRFMRLSAQLFALLTIFGCAVVLPVNLAAVPDTSKGAVLPEGFDTMSLANVGPESPLLWVHFTFVYVFSLCALFLVHRNFQGYAKLRHAALRSGQPHHQWAMVRDLPEAYREEGQLAAYFQRMYPDTFVRALVARSTGELGKVVAKREKVVRKLERCHWTEREKGERPQHKTKALGLCGEKVDSINFYEKELQDLNADIATRQSPEGLTAEGKAGSPPTCTGFVAFRTLESAVRASQTLHTADPMTLRVTRCPEPRDVFWPNLRVPLRERAVRDLVVFAAVFFLVFFWTIPILFVGGLCNLENLQGLLPFLKPVIEGNKALKGFLEGFLPSLALLIFMAILPLLLLLISKLQGIETHSALATGVLSKYFYFQVFNVFLGVTLASGIIAVLEQIIDRPTSIVGLLATSLPGAATTFINYVCLQSLAGYPLQLLQIGRLVGTRLKLKWLAKTARERREALHPQPYKFGEEIPKQLLVFMVAMVYSVINPIILPFAFVFFGLGYLSVCYNLVYVHVPESEGEGLLWEYIVNRIVAALAIFQLTVIGVLGLKKAALPSSLLIPLLVFTLLVRAFWGFRYLRPALHLPLDQCPETTVVTPLNEPKDPPPDADLFLAPPLAAAPRVGVETAEVWGDVEMTTVAATAANAVDKADAADKALVQPRAQEKALPGSGAQEKESLESV